MKRATSAFAATTAALLSLLIIIAGAPPAYAADSADDCVRMQETQSGTGLTLNIDNNCARALSCNLAWTVECQSASGKVTRSSRESARLIVNASASQAASASAKSCGDNWRIDDVSWDCAPIK